MSSVAYVYSLETDFPNHKLDSDRLASEINQSRITTALDYISRSGDSVSVHFKATLPTEDKTILDAVISYHQGEAPQKNALQVELVSPASSDGKPIFQPTIFPTGVYLYITGAADDVAASSRGTGAAFFLSSDAAGESSLTFQFMDWVYIAGGGIQARGAEPGDAVSLKVHAPATPVTHNAGGTGNCTLVDPGVGAPILIVPAAGNGTHDVDLSLASPVPASDGNGYYDWTGPSKGKGAVVASSMPQKAEYNLYTVQVDMTKFVNRYPLVSNQYIDLTVPSITPRKILPHWQFVVSAHNGGHAGLKLAWNLVLARTTTV